MSPPTTRDEVLEDLDQSFDKFVAVGINEESGEPGFIGWYGESREDALDGMEVIALAGMLHAVANDIGQDALVSLREEPQ